MTDIPCPACRKPFRALPMGEKYGYLFNACRACGSIFSDPGVTQGTLDRIMAEAQPVITHVANPEAEIEALRRRLFRLIPAELIGKRFLDLTHAQGYVVMAARKMGMNAKGVSNLAPFTLFAQKHYAPELFIHATAAQYAEQGHQADFIFCHEIFSTQPGPEAVAAALAKMLAPGGKIYIEEPDGNSIWLPRNFGRWRFVNPPLNSAYISYAGMKSLLRRHGLKVERKFFTLSPFMRLLVSK